MDPRPRPIKLSEPRATEIIRAAAENSSLVFIVPHARDRMVKRGITRKQILQVLSAGVIIEGPTDNLMHGNWQCKVQGYSSGSNVQAEIAIERNEKNVIIITVFAVG